MALMCLEGVRVSYAKGNREIENEHLYKIMQSMGFRRPEKADDGALTWLIDVFKSEPDDGGWPTEALTWLFDAYKISTRYVDHTALYKTDDDSKKSISAPQTIVFKKKQEKWHLCDF